MWDVSSSPPAGGRLSGAEPPIHEEMVPHPVAPYGASKLAGEGYCSAYFQTFGVETVALLRERLRTPLGPQEQRRRALYQEGRGGEVLEIYGDGTQTRDFIFVDDLIRAVRLSATVEGVGGEVFQIATSAETTVQELTDRLLPALAAEGVRTSRSARRPPAAGRCAATTPTPPRRSDARLEGRSRPRRGPQAHRGMVLG